MTALRGLLLPEEDALPKESAEQLTLRINKSKFTSSINEGSEFRLVYGDMPPVDVKVLEIADKAAA